MKTLQPERNAMHVDDDEASPINKREESMVRTRSYPNKRSNSMKYDFLFHEQESKKNKVQRDPIDFSQQVVMAHAKNTDIVEQ